MEDFEAIRSIQQGDISGLELLVTRYQLKVIRTAFLITHDARLAKKKELDASGRWHPTRIFGRFTQPARAAICIFSVHECDIGIQTPQTY